MEVIEFLRFLFSSPFSPFLCDLCGKNLTERSHTYPDAHTFFFASSFLLNNSSYFSKEPEYVKDEPTRLPLRQGALRLIFY